jgi:hypothetical protein
MLFQVTVLPDPGEAVWRGAALLALRPSGGAGWLTRPRLHAGLL